MGGRPGGRLGKSYFQKLSTAEQTHFVGYLKGDNTHTVERALEPSERAMVGMSIVPFGITVAASPDPADFYRVSATTQAIKIAKLIQSSLAVFGIQGDPPDTHTSKGGFYPALARPAVRQPNATKGNKTSSFSGKPYKGYDSRSGSIPFGRPLTGSNTKDYEAQKQAIANAWSGLENTSIVRVSLSFVPEYWDKVTEATSSKANSVSGNVEF